MYTDLMRLDKLRSIARDYDCNVTREGNHWIVTIGVALTHGNPGVCMDVSNNLKRFRLTQIPQSRETRRSNVNVTNQAI